jgi:HSP20 family protein
MYLTTLDRDFDRLVRRAFGPAAVSGFASSLGTALPMDTIRRDGEVVLRFDIPGVDPEKIDVTVDHGYLTVSATREETKTEGDQRVVRERYYGNVTVREEAKPRKITVGASKELAS